MFAEELEKVGHTVSVNEFVDRFKTEDGGYNLQGLDIPFSEFLGENVKYGFDTTPLISSTLQEAEIEKRERAAGEYDYLSRHWDPLAGGERPVNPHVMTEEEWKASEWYRENINFSAYKDLMTPSRAQVMAEKYDERRFREQVLSAGGDGVGRTVAGFGAMMLGGLPDPINLIPFGAGATQARTAAIAAGAMGKSAVRAGLVQGAKTGAIAGTLGGATSAAIAFPRLADEGEELGWADFFLTTGMSGALGGILGGIGGMFTGIAARQTIAERMSRFAETEGLRNDLVTRMSEAMSAVRPGEDPARIRAEAAAAASIFDARARTWFQGDILNRTPEQYYQDWSPDFISALTLEDRIRTEFNEFGGGDTFLDMAQPVGEAQPLITREDLAAQRAAEQERARPQRRRGAPQEQQPRPETNIRQDQSRTSAVTDTRTEVQSRQTTVEPSVGAETTLVTSSGDIGVRYEVRELADLVPSHDARNHFAVRQDYPEGIQERWYHSDQAEQNKVIDHAANLDPRYLVNTNPDAVNGPPIISSDGYVLGGNSRTMSLSLAYQRGTAGGYAEALKTQAAAYGIDPASLDRFSEPVLVRVAKNPMSQEEMAVAARRFNEAPTQDIQSAAKAESRAKLLSHQSITEISNKLDTLDIDNLNDFLKTEESRAFVESLRKDGAIAATESNLLNEEGLLSDKGRESVIAAMRALAVSDSERLARFSQKYPSLVNKIDGVLPSILRLKMQGGAWDMTAKIDDALSLIEEAMIDARGKGSLRGAVRSFLLPGETIVPMQDKYSDAAKVLALTFTSSRPSELRIRLRQMNLLADQARGRSGGLIGNTGPTAGSAFVESFVNPLAVVDGQPVGTFAPTENLRHAAIDFVHKMGGSVDDALESVAAVIKTSGSIADREYYQTLRKEIMKLQGSAFQVLDPDLGTYHTDKKSLFQRDATGRVQGSMSMQEGHAVVSFFQASDFSTAPHEIFHIFRRELAQTARIGTDIEKADWKTICDFVGVGEREQWSRAQEEKFVEAGMQYLREGKAPSLELHSVFAKMKEWFLNLYRSLTDAGTAISPEMRAVFDRMLAPQWGRDEYAKVLRMGLRVESKRDLMRAMELALQDFSKGNPVNVQPVLRDSSAVSEAQSLLSSYGARESEAPAGADPSQTTSPIDPDPAPGERVTPERTTAPEQNADQLSEPRPRDVNDVIQTYEEKMREALRRMDAGRGNDADAQAERAMFEEINSQINEMREQGRLSDDDILELTRNREQTERAAMVDEDGQAALSCVWSIGQ